MAIQNSLLLNLTVYKLLPRPQSASVGIGLFRVSCPAVEGHIVSDQTFVMKDGDVITRVQACSALVIRTDRPVTVELKKGLVTNTLVVDQLFAATTPLDSLTITYTADTDTPLATASVSLIQS